MISETGYLFHNFYELLFTGIDQNKEMMYIFCTSSYKFYIFKKYLYNIGL